MNRRKRLVMVMAGVGLPAAFAVAAEEVNYLGEMVITAPVMSDPLTVETDPRTPRSTPAADGAAYLDNIPGFSTVRKGGSSGDPVFRGLGGSRLNILQNDTYLFGGCGGRMDPPTAYIYPESFERVTVVKGPQTVLRGGGNLAGTVLFERRTERFEAAGSRFLGSALAGSYGRNDQMADFTAGGEGGFARIIGTRAAAGDYRDGDGNAVHSEYARWSGTAIAGWTPDDDTRLEFTFERSDGEAAYADRTMDGTEFDRTGYDVRLETDLPGDLGAFTAQYYHNYVDHVMDNFSLRDAPGVRAISNPDRETAGARLALDLTLGDATFATVGVDQRSDEHTKRMDNDMDGVLALGARVDDMSLRTAGVFAELEHQMSPVSTLVGGLRFDRTQATAESAIGGAAAGEDDEDSTHGAFVRLEHSLDPATVVFVGLGGAERSPDYWERAAVFDLDPERLTQLDLGFSYRTAALTSNVSAFYGRIEDFILIDWTNKALSSNVDATTYGFEVDAGYRLAPFWKATATLAYTWGNNDTHDRPLAQIPPLEGTVGLDYDNGSYSAGVLVRAAMEQDRVDVGRGGIAGADVGESDGFTVLSLHGGYRINPKVALTAGVDNLLDATYAEHISRAGVNIPDFEPTEQVNEPGRTYWVKATARF